MVGSRAWAAAAAEGALCAAARAAFDLELFHGLEQRGDRALLRLDLLLEAVGHLDLLLTPR